MALGMEVGLGPGHIVLDGDPAPPQKKQTAQPPIFGPCPLWLNGCMYQDTTWFGGRPQPRWHCVRWGPSSPSPKGAQPPPQFLANVRCGQTAGWSKTPLGMEVGLGPGDLCSTGTQLPPQKKGHSPLPNFWPMSIVAKQLDGSRCHLVRR